MRRCKQISSVEYRAILAFASGIALLAAIGFVYFYNKAVAETQMELFEKANWTGGLDIYPNNVGNIVPFLYLVLVLLPLLLGLSKRVTISVVFTFFMFLVFSMELVSFFYSRFYYEKNTLDFVFGQYEQHFSPIGIYLFSIAWNHISLADFDFSTYKSQKRYR